MLYFFQTTLLKVNFKIIYKISELATANSEEIEFDFKGIFFTGFNNYTSDAHMLTNNMRIQTSLLWLLDFCWAEDFSCFFVCYTIGSCEGFNLNFVKLF